MRLKPDEQAFFDGYVTGYVKMGGDKYVAGREARAIIREKRKPPKTKQLRFPRRLLR